MWVQHQRFGSPIISSFLQLSLNASSTQFSFHVFFQSFIDHSTCLISTNHCIVDGVGWNVFILLAHAPWYWLNWHTVREEWRIRRLYFHSLYLFLLPTVYLYITGVLLNESIFFLLLYWLIHLSCSHVDFSNKWNRVLWLPLLEVNECIFTGRSSHFQNVIPRWW